MPEPMVGELGEAGFRIWSSRLLDRIMPLPVSVACLSAAYIAGPNWLIVLCLSAAYIGANFWLSAKMVGPQGAVRVWLVGYGRAAVSYAFLPVLIYVSGVGGPGWFVALPSAATLPFAFREGKAWAPVVGLIVATVLARYLMNCTLTQAITSVVALGTTAFITGGLASALKREVDRALRAERVQSDFLATMSHEIRTPMHGVLASLELMDSDNLSSQQHELIAAARSSASGLLAIINDVLDFSKIQAGKLNIDPVTFGLQPLIHQLKHEFAPRATEEGTVLTVVVGSDLPGYLTGDPHRIAQIIRNYLSNGLKFGRGTRVELVVTGTVIDHSCEVRVEVTDGGPGISFEAQNRLFARFEQISQGTARKYGGTGLGLAISRQLADLMSGEVGVRSVPGQGATFWLSVRLPIAEAPARIPTKELQQLRGPLDVLVVDDNAVNRMVAIRMLEKLGCRAMAVDGGSQAIDTLHHRTFDCILMDCQMPDMDGFEATRLIRAIEGAAAYPSLR